jgi:transposase-like protein
MKHNYYKNKKWLEEQYIVLKKSFAQIAKEVECDSSTIHYWSKKLGIPSRSLSESLKGKKMSEERRKKLCGRKQTKESNEARSKKLKGRKFSDTTLKKMSIAQTGKIVSDEARANMRKAKKYISDETKQKMSDNHANVSGIQNPMFGKHHNDSTRKLISEANKKINLERKLSGKKHPLSGKPANHDTGFGKGCYFTKSDGITVWLRSTYELYFAIALEQKEIKWEYEKRFDLQDEIWHPDFYLPEYDLFVETKGWLTDTAKRKMIKFNNEYSNIKLLVLEKKDIDLFLNTNIPITDVGVSLRDYLQHLNLI